MAELMRKVKQWLVFVWWRIKRKKQPLEWSEDERRIIYELAVNFVDTWVFDKKISSLTSEQAWQVYAKEKLNWEAVGAVVRGYEDGGIK